MTTDRFAAHSARCLTCNVTIVAPTMLQAVYRYAAHYATNHEEPSMSETPICPECEQGKHPNCDGSTWDPQRDEEAVCPCPH